MKNLIIVTILTVCSSHIFGQEIKKDSLHVNFVKYEITEQDAGILGMQKVILGSVIIKRNYEIIATHDFLVPIMKEPLSHIAVLDSAGKRIDPRIHYNIEEKAFSYFEKTPKEGKVKVKDGMTQKELVLFGLWIWATLIY